MQLPFLENFDIPQILSFGSIGLGFLLAFLTFKIIRKEQDKETPKKEILKSCYIYMVFSLILVGFGFAAEMQKIKNTEPQIITTKNQDKDTIKTKVITEKSKLTLIGSGTVCNFLKTETKEIVEDLNINIFSGPSVTSLELLLNIGVDGNSYSDIIALSSIKRTEEELLDKKGWRRFKKADAHKKIIAIKIADDPLLLGILQNNMNLFNSIDNNRILDTMLLDLIINNNNSYDVFCTNRESGTVKTYEHLLKKIDSTFTWPNNISFYASSSTKEVILNNEKPFIFLGSKNYTIPNTNLIKIINQQNQTHKKELYLYFVVSKKEFVQNGYYEICGHKGKFIMELKRHFNNENIVGDTLKIDDISGKNILFEKID